MKVAVAAPPSAEAAERLDRRTILVVAVMAAAAFMAVLDGTVVTVAIDTFTTTFDSSVATIGWVSVGYLLAAAVSLPISGWAVERFGGRRVFLAGIAVFVLGSALSSLAWSAGSLIAFRVVQGFGGGALEPTALTLAARTADGRRVGAVMGLLSLVVNVAPVLGPLLGGLLVEGGHWRWIFLINVPLGLVVAAVALLVVANDPGDPAAVGSDLRGLGLLSPGFAAVLFAIERIGAEAPLWSILLPAALGTVLLGWYVARSLRVTRPVIDLRMFASAGFASSVGVMALVGFLMYSQLVALPLYARDVHDLAGIASGVLVTALGGGLLVSMALAARRSDVVGPRRLAGPGAVVTTAGLAVFAAIHDTCADRRAGRRVRRRRSRLRRGGRTDVLERLSHGGARTGWAGDHDDVHRRPDQRLVGRHDHRAAARPPRGRGIRPAGADLDRHRRADRRAQPPAPRPTGLRPSPVSRPR